MSYQHYSLPTCMQRALCYRAQHATTAASKCLPAGPPLRAAAPGPAPAAPPPPPVCKGEEWQRRMIAMVLASAGAPPPPSAPQQRGHHHGRITRSTQACPAESSSNIITFATPDHPAPPHIQLLGLPGVHVCVVAAQLDQQVGREGGEARALGGLRWMDGGGPERQMIDWRKGCERKHGETLVGVAACIAAKSITNDAKNGQHPCAEHCTEPKPTQGFESNTLFVALVPHHHFLAGGSRLVVFYDAIGAPALQAGGEGHPRPDLLLLLILWEQGAGCDRV